MLLNILLSSPPPDIWHDPTSQFIAAIVAAAVSVMTVIVALVLQVRLQRRRAISYEVISDKPIASLQEEVEGRMELRLSGKPVKDVSLLTLKLWNSGNIPVAPEDYLEPITFKFEGRAVVGGSLQGTEPKHLIDLEDTGAFFTLGIDAVELPKILLNPKDSITINVLLTGPYSKIIVRGRIIDTEIDEIE